MHPSFIIFITATFWLMINTIIENPILGTVGFLIVIILTYHSIKLVKTNPIIIDFINKVFMTIEFFRIIDAKSQMNKSQNLSIATNEFKHQIIEYNHQGNKYILRIPYHSTLVASMSNLQVFLINLDGSSKEITQQPGVPYMFTAHECGAIQIVAKNLDNEKQKHYGHNERPMFCNDVLD